MSEFERGEFGKAIKRFGGSSDFPPMEERRKAWVDPKANHAPKEKASVASVVGMVSLALLAGYLTLGKETDTQRVAVEGCVSDLVDRNVSIPRDGLGELQHPKSVFSEQRACEQNENDPVLARQNLRHIPLGE